MSIVRKLHKLELLRGIQPFALDTHYEVIIGSFAYGVSNNTSDVDLYGFYTPPIDYIFPHTDGHIHGFGKAPPSIKTIQKHGIIVTGEEKEYDLSLYTIVQFFNLCMENNPNMIDALFVPDRCIVHSDEIGRVVREHRKLFLHKGCWHRLKGYAYQQMKKMHSQTRTGKRAQETEKHGYDLKFAYHIVRLLEQGEQILTEHDLTLDREDRREKMKAIRRGEWTLEQVTEYFKKREQELDTVYIESDLRYTADEELIKKLLIQCIEIKYGSISNFLAVTESGEAAIKKLAAIKDIINQ